MATVIVSGSSGGIGSATVAAFLAAGFDVVGLDRVAAPDVDGVRHKTVDLTDEGALASVLDGVGPVQHLVAVAGGALLNEKTVADLTELSVDTFRSSLEQNLVSVFITIRAALPHIRQATGDRSITLTSSTDAFLSYGLPAYAAAKGGLMGMVHSLAVPLGREGLRINAVAPGDVPTERNVAEFGHIPDWYAGLTNATALGRLCTPADIAAGFLSIAVQLTGMTGQVLVLDAGLTVAAGGATAVGFR
jgi:NAD(P)-dependent dehydrogenase (short-subunit alcohol dehydrogenase family)